MAIQLLAIKLSFQISFKVKYDQAKNIPLQGAALTKMKRLDDREKYKI